MVAAYCIYLYDFNTEANKSIVSGHCPHLKYVLVASCFYQPGASKAHTQLVLRLLYIFCVCCLYVRPHLSRAKIMSHTSFVM